MRIMWHGVAPWCPTGYGTQAAVWCKRLKEAGHEVIISAYAGADVCAEVDWQGMPVLPSTPFDIAVPLVMTDRLARVKPDLTVILGDVRNMPMAQIYRDHKVAVWIPGDADRLSAGDAQFLQQSAARPMAMSRHMQKILEDAGYDAPYVPHGIDTDVFKPADDRAAVRAELGVEPGMFVVGINARNLDPMRKFVPEQIASYAKFRKRHPESTLLLHTMAMNQPGIDVQAVLRSLGLKQPAVVLPPQPQMYLDMFPQEAMVKWYQSLDVLLNCSRGEGFGLAAAEAQACGTPVIVADNTTGPELKGPGWLVKCEPHWNGAHEAWWGTPSQSGIVDALVKASSVSDVAGKRQAARLFGQQFDVETVWPLFEKALAELTT